MPDLTRFAFSAEQEAEFSDELRGLLQRWARELAGADDDTPLYHLDAATRHAVELARLAVANGAAKEVADVEDSAAYRAAAYGSTYGELATAAGMTTRHTARYRYPKAREAMRSRKWVQRNRASWLAALRVLLALEQQIHPTDEMYSFLLGNLHKLLPERDADVDDETLVDALDRVDWFTRDARTADSAAREAITRARALVTDWKAQTSAADSSDTEDDEE